MDTLTHIVLGASIGEAMAGKELGRKALLIGAVANSLPDIDFVASLWLPVSTDLLAHRGFTHSILFMLLASSLIASLCRRLFSSSGISFARWGLFWALQISVHLFIDCFNVYGTGIFEPFSHYRVSFNTLYVADPLFSVWPAIAAIILLVNRRKTASKFWAYFGLGCSTIYLMTAVFLKWRIDYTAQSETIRLQQHPVRYFTTPTPLNSLLWYVVSESDSGYNIGYRSVFDQSEHIAFHYVPKNTSLITPGAYKDDLPYLKRFSNGYYTLSRRNDTLLFNDIRFGEILGWSNPENGFVFYYCLQYPDANKLIVQRGRFAGWNRENFGLFLKRIKGI